MAQPPKPAARPAAPQRPLAPPSWLPPVYDIADASAIQALHRGDATPDQQRRALDWIIRRAANTYDLSFRPGPDGERETNFAEGRRFVGLELVKLINLSVNDLQKVKHG